MDFTWFHKTCTNSFYWFTESMISCQTFSPLSHSKLLFLICSILSMTRQNMTFKILLVCMLHTETHSTLNMFNKYIFWGFINNLKIIRTQLKHNHLTVK